MKLANSSLKIIAIVSMVIDHVGAIVIGRLILGPNSMWEPIYWGMRYIGRIAFPIFCFLLVEGFFHTRSKKKYLFNLMGLAVLSEIPFDIALIGELSFSDQNIFVTLSIGLIMLYMFEKIKKAPNMPIIKTMLFMLSFLISCFFAYITNSDYSYWGISVIATMYVFKSNRLIATGLSCVILCFMSLTSLTAFFAVPLIGLYNGERGLNLKYIFYFFYPVHLVVLYCITYLIFLFSH